MEEVISFLPEDRQVDFLSVLENDSVYRYQLSIESNSNSTTAILQGNLWETNRNLINEKSAELLKFINVTAQNYATANSWKSNLSNCVDPFAYFEKSVQPCTSCSQVSSSNNGLEQLQSNKCVCNVNVAEVNNEYQTNLRKTKKPIGLATNSNSISDCGPKSVEDRQLFRPKFGNSKVTTNNRPPSKCSSHDADLENEDTKALKSNVSKITFKTAKEQFLASNPAAKRTLGTSRKAQSKFVSPMIGAQEKQEYCEPEITDERLKHIDPKMIELIESEIIDKGTPIAWNDIAGLLLAKSVIQEAVVWPLLRPDIFTGLRRPPKGILLFGPPGTGKTLIGKCIASQCSATFFSISASSLTSKWIGDGEKMVRALFAVARCRQPAVVFIDEIDSLLTQRNDTEHEATRRIKTEFLVQFDGAGTGDEDRLLIVGATNRPQELDEAARRRLVKRLYIPLPDIEARKQIISNLLKTERNDLTSPEVDEIARLTDGYSGADMKSLCSEAAMGPVRAVPFSEIITINTENVRPVNEEDFKNALQRVRPSVSQDDLGQYVKWNKMYGQGF